MPLTLSSVLQSVYSQLGELNTSKATGGSTTTVTDTTIINASRDNVWKEGVLFMVYDVGGAGAAPEGQFQRVSGFVNSTGVFTVDTAFTTAPAANDLYGVASSYYPLRQMIRSVNDGLVDLGDIDLMDTATLDTIIATTEYAAAVSWKRTRPYRVDIQTLTSSATDNQWYEWHNWDWVPATAGTAGKIIFHEYPTALRDIRVWYKGVHPQLNEYGDVVWESFDPELVKKAALVKALEWQNSRTQGADTFLTGKLNAALQQLENRKVTSPVWHPRRKPRLMIVNPTTYDAGDDIATP
jgi:hypothetical protein